MADRTVSVRLRADVTAFIAAMRAAAAATRQFGDEVERSGRRASGAFDRAGDSAERLEQAIRRLLETERREREEQQRSEQARRQSREETRRHSEQTRRQTNETRRNSNETRRNTQENSRNAGQLRLSTRVLISLGAAATAGGAAIVSAGVAAAAFGAVAAPSIIRVVAAQEDLAANWGDLSAQQRVSADLVRGLAAEYRDLARSYEPQALQAFNTLVGSTRALLPQVDDVVAATSGSILDLTSRIGAFATGPEVSQFLEFAAANAPDALDGLGTAVTQLGTLTLRLLQDLEPLGMAMLELANGALGALNAVAAINPVLAQLAVTTLLLRGPIMAVTAGLASMQARMAASSAAAANLSRTQRAVNLAAAAGPNLFVAGAVALGYWALVAGNAKSRTDRLVESLRESYKASGNNVEGYQMQAQALNAELSVSTARLTQMQGKLTSAFEDGSAAGTKARLQAVEQAFAQDELTAAITKADTAARNVITGAAELAARYGITRTAAIQLADAAGVNMAQSIDKSGKLSASAALRIEHMRQSIVNAQNPTRVLALSFDTLNSSTSTAEQRTKALSAAYNAQLGPALNVFNANLRLRDGFAQLSQSVRANSGSLTGNTAAARQARGAFAQQIETVWQLFQAQAQETGGRKRATAAVRQQLPALYLLAGQNSTLRGLVDRLALSTGNATGATNLSRASFLRAADSMRISRDRAERLWKELRKIKSRRVSVTVDAVGKFNLETAGGRMMPGSPMATGGPVPTLSPAGRGKDSVPAMLMPDEHVWTTREVAAAGGHGAMHRLRRAALRGELRGYARGGRVSFSHDRRADPRVVGDVLRPVTLGINDTVLAVARSLATIWKKYVQSGGPVVAAARSQIGVPYVWGGTAWNRGLDCSGLTQGAWRRGAGVDITRTTYTQWPNSRAISGPRPGALGFPHIGHVVLASGRGTIIEAPYTGARVREVASHRGYQWRWPNAARFAEGGPVSAADARPLGRRFIGSGGTGSVIVEAKALHVAGDPGNMGIPGFAGGGWVGGQAGRDRALIAATAGEFVVRRDRAAQFPALLESVNSGRVGDALIRRTIPARASLMTGGAGAHGGGGRTTVHLHVHNHGVIGNQLDMDNWLSTSVDRLDRQGRVPWQPKR